VPADRALLISELGRKTRLKHNQYYPSGNAGSGVLVSSAFPIREAWFHRFQAIAPPWKVWEGDGMAGKGVGLARIELPDGAGFVDFFNTHAQAGYGNPDYKVIRKQEMAEVAEFINAARCGTVPAFLTGDLNCRRNEPEHITLVQGAKFHRPHLRGTRSPLPLRSARIPRNPRSRPAKRPTLRAKRPQRLFHRGQGDACRLTKPVTHPTPRPK
jgi:hypothetical protein